MPSRDSPAYFVSTISSEKVLDVRRDHGVFRRRVAVYHRSYRRHCTSRIAETGELPQPRRPYNAYDCPDR